MTIKLPCLFKTTLIFSYFISFCGISSSEAFPLPVEGFSCWQWCIYPQGKAQRVWPHTRWWSWWHIFQAPRYQECYRTELLPNLTAEWLEFSPPSTGADSSNPSGPKCDNWNVYVGGWINPEYSMAWLKPVVGFDCWQCCIYPQGSGQRVRPHTWGGWPWLHRFQAARYQECFRIELLPSLTAEWLESSPSNNGVDGSNTLGLKCNYWKGRQHKCWRLDISRVLCGLADTHSRL